MRFIGFAVVSGAGMWLPALCTDIRSWWEVPCIAHFCHSFKKPFHLPEFDIEVCVVCAVYAMKLLVDESTCQACQCYPKVSTAPLLTVCE